MRAKRIMVVAGPLVAVLGWGSLCGAADGPIKGRMTEPEARPAKTAAAAAEAAPPAAAPTASPVVPVWRERQLTAMAAFREGRYAACRESLLAAQELTPGHPSIVYVLARVEALLGHRREALAALAEYAAMGLTQDVARDSSFAALWSDTGFARLAKQLEANGAARSRAEVFHRFSDPDLLVEDVAWDPSGRWFASSIRERKIVVIDADGQESDLVPSADEGVWGIFALQADPGRRRLWATTAATAEMRGGAGPDSGRTGVLCYDLDRGRLIRRLGLPSDGRRHVFGDLLVAPDGTVYVTDSAGGGLYRVPVTADTLEMLMAPGSMNSPQTPVMSADLGRLFIADYSRGIASFDLANRYVHWMRQPADLASAGIDGLYRVGNELIAIQNGTEPRRVLALTLSPGGDEITGWRVLEQASPWLGEPNHGVVVGGDLVLIGNSGWDRVGRDGGMRPGAKDHPPVLMRLPLK